jgi:hypothetical protein
MSEGYLGNQHLKKTGVPIEWTPELIREYAKCAADPVYFAKKYIKIVHVDRGLVPFEMYPYQEQIAREITDHRRVAVLTARQSGKALALDTRVPLFDGTWTTIADLKIGDVIIGSNGQQTTVTFKSEIHNKPSYVMTFESSDSPVVACEDHLWTVWDRYTRKFVTKTTKQLAANYKVVNKRGYSEYRYAISNIKPIKYPHRDLPVDPYTIGCWLGDGASASNTFTCHNDDRHHYESKGIGFTSDVSYERNSSNTVFTSGIADLRPLLRQLGLLKNKHIPKEYLISSIEQRTSLLQGLMDTDGFIDGQCNIQLSRKNQQLIDDVYQLIVSLGFKVRVSHFESTNSTRLTFNTYEGSVIPVSIPRKLERLTVKKRDRYISSRSITSIRLTDSVPTQCITVDADDSLFAFGRDYILTHNTTTAMAIILHYILFNEFKTVAILANKGDSAREVLSRVQLAYESLPKWLQQGILEWNKGSIELENGCKIYAGTTSSSAIRGKSISFLYLDEVAFIEGYDEFFASVYPTISSGESTKLLMTSTPNGLNHFYKTCVGAEEGTNGYRFVKVMWYDVPGRDERWRQETLAALDHDTEKFKQEYCCEFLGSSGTLISGERLKVLKDRRPVVQSGSVKQYVPPTEGHVYALIADVSRGKGLDYSTFSVFDVTEMPYKQVCIYRDNTIGPGDYAGIIHRLGTLYNEAHVLIEINDNGGQVADTLFFEFGYENMLFTEHGGRTGKRISGGFGKGVDRGIKTSKSVKSIGCSILKLLIEQEQLIVNDFDTIEELKHFSRKGASYEAESGWHDDMVMTLVLFSWLTDQNYFKDVTDINTLMTLRQLSDDQIAEDLIPFGFVVSGNEEKPIAFVDAGGDVWMEV